MKPEKKLSLNKETLKALGQEEAHQVAGGLTLYACTTICYRVTMYGACKTDLCGGTTSR